MVVAAIFGAVTASPKIILTQGLPAVVALVLLFITKV
nr:DUF1304 family protein [Lentilactobacillus parafarraginis]